MDSSHILGGYIGYSCYLAVDWGNWTVDKDRITQSIEPFPDATIVLPSAANVAQEPIWIAGPKRGKVRIDPIFNETINGLSGITLSQPGGCMQLVPALVSSPVEKEKRFGWYGYHWHRKDRSCLAVVE